MINPHGCWKTVLSLNNNELEFSKNYSNRPLRLYKFRILIGQTIKLGQVFLMHDNFDFAKIYIICTIFLELIIISIWAVISTAGLIITYLIP